MFRDYRVYLDDIKEAVRKIKNFTGNIDLDGFSGDEMAVDAVIYNLEKISSASANIPGKIRYLANTVRWHELENIMGLIKSSIAADNIKLAWEAVNLYLPPLDDRLEMLLEWSGELAVRENMGKGMFTNEQGYERWY